MSDILVIACGHCWQRVDIESRDKLGRSILSGERISVHKDCEALVRVYYSPIVHASQTDLKLYIKLKRAGCKLKAPETFPFGAHITYSAKDYRCFPQWKNKCRHSLKRLQINFQKFKINNVYKTGLGKLLGLWGQKDF